MTNQVVGRKKNMKKVTFLLDNSVEKKKIIDVGVQDIEVVKNGCKRNTKKVLDHSVEKKKIISVGVQDIEVVKNGKNKEEGVSNMSKRKKRCTTKKNSSVCCGDGENVVTNVVEDLPRKRKRGTNAVISEAFVLSREEVLYKLRPRKLIPSFQKVELNESDFARVVGKRVKVYGSNLRKWFVGCVTSFDYEKRLHTILYENGDKNDLDLKRERFELEVVSNEAFKRCSGLRPNIEKKEMTSNGSKVNEEVNSSPNIADAGQVEKNVRMKNKQVSKDVEQGKPQCHRGKDKEQKLEKVVRDVDIDVCLGDNKGWVTVDVVNSVDKPKSVEDEDNLGGIETLPKVVNKTNQEYDGVNSINPKTICKNEMANQKGVKKDSVNAGNSYPKEDETMKKKVALRTLTRASKLRARR
ncbi:hypothetical protein AQUCO_00900291v1 [Aquilegia coerulea]|uniref:Uncharacterized protein n=1 Tax=Aquilegia coerulea TaxID=218851 RepID=A0A2G5ECX5_AQUCA|nr:hypothetical protein AQUCO_00900291v1 [Aquilegia coerulea]